MSSSSAEQASAAAAAAAAADSTEEVDYPVRQVLDHPDVFDADEEDKANTANRIRRAAPRAAEQDRMEKEADDLDLYRKKCSIKQDSKRAIDRLTRKAGDALSPLSRVMNIINSQIYMAYYFGTVAFPAAGPDGTPEDVLKKNMEAQLVPVAIEGFTQERGDAVLDMTSQIDARITAAMMSAEVFDLTHGLEAAANLAASIEHLPEFVIRLADAYPLFYDIVNGKAYKPLSHEEIRRHMNRDFSNLAKMARLIGSK